jgi:hypothetical protein
LTGDFLHFFALLIGQIGAGPSENIEYRQLFFAQVLAHVAGLFSRQDIGEIKQFPENFFDIAAAGVVAFDQVLNFSR